MAPETRYGSSHGRTEADDDLRDVHGDERESDDELARLRAELDDAEATKDNQNELLKAMQEEIESAGAGRLTHGLTHVRRGEDNLSDGLALSR